MAKKKKAPESPEPSGIYHTMAQTAEAQNISQQLSEFQDLKQHEEAPKIPGYMILKPIGRGAYAQVWEAIQVRTRRFVAIKIFVKKGGVHWFFLQREAERLIRLDKHPNIVSLLDADLGGETPYYVMDLAQEGSLEGLIQKSKLSESGLFKVEQAADWMEQIGQALQYVHHKQMVHCDLKPANVLLDDEGHVRVADFGNSRVLSESGSALGTLFFMAPEQAVIPDENHPIQPDVRWDIYALGCTAYAMLSGHVPHEEIGGQLESMAAVEDRLKLYRDSIAHSPVPPLFEMTQGRVDRDLSAIIDQCMKPNPLDRYKSVNDILKDLKARREGKPVSPLSRDFGYWAGKFVTRHRFSVLMAALAAGVALTAWFFGLKHQQAQVQDKAFNYVLRGREYLDKDDEASAAAYFAASNKLFPSLLARGNAVIHMPPVPTALFPHNGSVVAVAFSPDGQTLLTAGGTSGARLWNAQTGAPLGGYLKTGATLTSAAFSPDETRLATGDSDGEARLWDAQSGKTLGAPMASDQAVHSTAFSPDGKTLLTAGADGSARLWEVPTGKPTKILLRHDDSIFTALFSPDGHRILTASKDGTAKLWDPGNGNPIDKPMKVELKGAPSWYKPNASFSPDGKTILLTGWDGSVWFYDGSNGHPQGRHLYLEGVGAQAVFSPDGRRILTSAVFAGADGILRVWNAKTRGPLKYTLHTNGKVSTLAFSPDGSKILAGTTDHAVWIWDTDSGDLIGKALWHGDAVTSAAFGPEGRLATGTPAGLGRLWDLDEDSQARTVLAWKGGNREHLKGLQNHAVFSHDGKSLLTYGGKTACLWDAQTGKPAGDVWVLPGTILRALFSPDDSHVLLCDAADESRLMDLSTGKSQILAQDGAVHAGAFSSDGRAVLTGGDDKTLRIWEASTGKEWGKPLDAGVKIEKVFLSPDGKKMAVLGSNHSFKLYPVKEEGAKATARADRQAQAASFSSDSRWVVAAVGSQAVLWDAGSGKVLRTFDQGHSLSSVLLSPDGRTIATFGTDGTARLWNGATGKPIGNPLKHDGPVQESAFSPKGQALVLAYQDGGWQVWDAQTGEPIGDENREGTLTQALGFLPDGDTLRFLGKNGTLKEIDSSWMSPTDPKELLERSRVAALCEVNSSGSLDPVPEDDWIKDWRQAREGSRP